MTDNKPAPTLLTPGPVDVRHAILEAQATPMTGHRTPAFMDLFARLQDKLKQAFFTEQRVYISGSSGTGLWEAASRNCVRNGKKILHLTNGAFSERWAKVSEANGKLVDTLAVEWGQAHTPEMLDEALSRESYDAVAFVHNESSTSVLNPFKELAEVIAPYEDTLILVDAVSSFAGAEIRVDEWGADVVLTSTQKALALPPGMALAAVSDRTLVRAAQVEYRGYYFDLLEMESRLQKNQTPSTPPISLMFALDRQLDDIGDEGMENRWSRHRLMQEKVLAWAAQNGFEPFAQEGYRSPTVTALRNTPGIDVPALADFMMERGYIIDKGYGKLKGQTFRITHMGDMQPEQLDEILHMYTTFLQLTRS